MSSEEEELTKTKSQIGRMSKNKGKSGEREVVHLLQDAGFEARRGQQFRGSPDSPDVICPALDEEWHIEVKRVERFSLYPTMDQCDDDRAPTQKPVIFHRSNKREWVCVIKSSSYIELVKRVQDAEKRLEVLEGLHG